MNKHKQTREEVARILQRLSVFGRVYSGYTKNVQESTQPIAVINFDQGESIPLTYDNSHDMTSTLVVTVFAVGDENLLDTIEQQIFDALSDTTLGGIVQGFYYSGFANNFGSAESAVVSREINFNVRFLT